MVNYFQGNYRILLYWLCAAIAGVGTVGALITSATAQGVTEDVSLTVSGNPPNNSTSGDSKISSDGRYVYFTSWASNLVANDTNATGDLFVRDLLTATTSLLSLNGSGQQVNGAVNTFDVSDGGRYIVFTSDATNLVTPDYNSGSDVYLRDTKTGVTSLIFRNQTTGQGAYDPVISGNGEWIAFRTRQTQSPYSDNNDKVYLINRRTLALTRISEGLTGSAANAGSSTPDINYDGSVIAFTSLASNLVNSDTNGQSDVFVWKKATNSISRISVSSAGTQANQYSQWPHISGDGNRIVFESYATNIASNATVAGQFKVLMHQLDTATTTFININSSGAEGSGWANRSDISESGNTVIFTSNATVTPSDTDTTADAFVRDLETNTTSLVGINSSGSPFAGVDATGDSLSADGQYVSFGSSNYLYIRYW